MLTTIYFVARLLQLICLLVLILLFTGREAVCYRLFISGCRSVAKYMGRFIRFDLLLAALVVAIP